MALLFAGCNKEVPKKNAEIALKDFECFFVINTLYRVSNTYEVNATRANHDSYEFTFEPSFYQEKKSLFILQWHTVAEISNKGFSVQCTYQGDPSFDGLLVVCKDKPNTWNQNYVILTKAECKAQGLEGNIIRGKRLRNFWKEFSSTLRTIQNAHNNDYFKFVPVVKKKALHFSRPYTGLTETEDIIL